MMGGKRSWSKEETFLLIKECERAPELWDIKCSDYKNKIKKRESLIRIAAIFNTDPDEIHRKFHNLRTQFQQELRKCQRKKIDTENGEIEDAYQTRWEYFDAMKFVLNAYNYYIPQVPFISSDNGGEPIDVDDSSTRFSPLKNGFPINDFLETFVSERMKHQKLASSSSSSSPPPMTAAAAAAAAAAATATATTTQPQLQQSSASTSTPLSSCLSSASSTSHKPKKRLSSAKRTSLNLALQASLHMLQKPPDEYQIFGDYVAAEIRGLRTGIGKRKLKRLIQKAIVEVIEEEEEFLRIQGNFLYNAAAHSST